MRSPVVGGRLRGGHSSQLWVHLLIFSCKTLFEAKGLGQKECLIISMLDNSIVSISKYSVCHVPVDQDVPVAGRGPRQLPDTRGTRGVLFPPRCPWAFYYRNVNKRSF